MSCDITDQQDVHRVVQSVITKFHKIDILVNFAGIIPSICWKITLSGYCLYDAGRESYGSGDQKSYDAGWARQN
ncbi:hypothetical protein BDV39DRAFT_171605 [Aspergillus sergii]|uniref:Uncharacterized protein n=1 Tax=Aspergillus sergii TaxID=1034303 RepID=A0A5N6X8M7_9EURO|nr:hypothetical protein BDV39DRAFT_171605 [Aspergillus sergii]